MLRRLPRLVLAALLASACGEPQLIERPETPPIEERFSQLKASSIDILFVVDDSRSMRSHHASLAANFDRFLELIDPDPDKIGERGEVDYRLALTTTEAGRNGGKLVGQPQVVRPGAGNTLDAFRRSVELLTKSEGSANEQGFAAAEQALARLGQLKDDKGKPLFMRDGAYLYIIIISDEEDGSFGEVRYFQRRFETIKGVGNENTVAVSAIGGPVPAGCAGAEAGHRYQELAALTGGVYGNICTEDWGSTLEELAVTGLGLRKRFQLRHPPRDLLPPEGLGPEDFLSLAVRYPCEVADDDPHLSEDICYAVDRSCGGGKPAVTCMPYYGDRDSWSFDVRENALVFDGAAVPGAGSEIVVRYYPRDK